MEVRLAAVEHSSVAKVLELLLMSVYLEIGLRVQEVSVEKQLFVAVDLKAVYTEIPHWNL